MLVFLLLVDNCSVLPFSAAVLLPYSKAGYTKVFGDIIDDQRAEPGIREEGNGKI
jgi:hypothetical protein